MGVDQFRETAKPFNPVRLWTAVCLILLFASHISQAGELVLPSNKVCEEVQLAIGSRQICTYTFPLRNNGAAPQPGTAAVETIKPFVAAAGYKQDPINLDYLAQKNAGYLERASGSILTPDDDGWLITDEGPWSKLENQDKFDCHAYTFSAKFGFQPDEEVVQYGHFSAKTEDGFLTLVKNQCAEVLQHEFRQPLRSTEVSPPLTWKAFFDNAEGKLRQGQIAVLEDNRDPQLPEYIHSGVLIRKNDFWFLKSKVGHPGPLLAIPLINLFNFLPEMMAFESTPQMLKVRVFNCPG